jgi:hypothetical protein
MLIVFGGKVCYMVHPARKQTISRAEFPHGFVVVLDGRQHTLPQSIRNWMMSAACVPSVLLLRT